MKTAVGIVLGLGLDTIEDIAYQTKLRSKSKMSLGYKKQFCKTSKKM